MKYLAPLALLFAMTSVGCTHNDKTAAGPKGSVNTPPAPPLAVDNRPEAPTQTDPGANGGYNLPATAPYQGGSTVSQNVNPAPFLAASQAQGSAASNAPSQTKPSRRRKK